MKVQFLDRLLSPLFTFFAISSLISPAAHAKESNLANQKRFLYSFYDASPFDDSADLYEWPFGDFGSLKNPPAPNIGQQKPSASSPPIRKSNAPQEEQTIKSTPSTESPKEEVVKNARMSALQGSRSRWSGQLNFTYSGPSISNPFSGNAPNPGNQVPPPLVTLSGTASVRYRLNDRTTVGLGTGITTQTPFQGPKNTSIADPYVDIAHLYKLGPFQSRAGFQATLWTNSQYRDTYGYRFGLSALNESFYQFKFGLTVGFLVQMDINLFADGSHYDPSQQTQYDIYTNPYFEFRLSDTFNLRSLIGIASLNNRNSSGLLDLYHPDVYQTFGIGISLGKAAFVYPFIQFFPFSGNMSAQTTLVGFNAIINLL